MARVSKLSSRAAARRAVFLPMVSDMSGCSGNQAVGVTMRELSLGLVRPIDAMRVWDIRRGIQALREIEGGNQPKLWIQASGVMAGNAL